MNCIVCLEALVNGQIIHTTSCGHLFHSICLGKWLRRNSIEGRAPDCPQCGTIDIDHHRVYFGLDEQDETEQCKQIENSKAELREYVSELTNLATEFTNYGVVDGISDHQVQRFDGICIALGKKFDAFKAQLKWLHAKLVSKKELFAIFAMQRLRLVKYQLRTKSLESKIASLEESQHHAGYDKRGKAKYKATIKAKNNLIDAQNSCCLELSNILAKVLDLYKNNCTSMEIYVQLLEAFGYTYRFDRGGIILVQQSNNSPQFKIRNIHEVDDLIMNAITDLLCKATEGAQLKKTKSSHRSRQSSTSHHCSLSLSNL